MSNDCKKQSQGRKFDYWCKRFIIVYSIHMLKATKNYLRLKVCEVCISAVKELRTTKNPMTYQNICCGRFRYQSPGANLYDEKSSDLSENLLLKISVPETRCHSFEGTHFLSGRLCIANDLFIVRLQNGAEPHSTTVLVQAVAFCPTTPPPPCPLSLIGNRCKSTFCLEYLR